MEENEGIFQERKKIWQTEIRRKEHQNLFTKKRREMTIYLNLNEGVIDDDRVMKIILEYIKSCSHTKGIEAMRQLIRMDPTTSLFFQVSGIVPENIPQTILQIMKTTIKVSRFNPKNISYNQFWKNHQWVQQNYEKLLHLETLISEWQRQNENIIAQILLQIHRFKDFNRIIEENLVEFFTFISNILIIGCWCQKLLNEVGQQQFISEDRIQKRSREFQSCFSILLNILAGPDEKILPFFNLILYSNGGNIRFLGLYYNLFQINGLPFGKNIEVLKIFTRVLNQNSNIFLQEHKEIIFILMIGLTKIDQIPPELEDEYIGLGQKLIYLLKDIMKVLNLRYDMSGMYLETLKTNSDLDDLQFIKNVAIVLKKLGQNVYLCRELMAAESIRTLISNNLRAVQNIFHHKAQKNFLQLLCKVVNDQVSRDYFELQPRFVTRILNNAQSVGKKPLNNVTMEEYQIVSLSFFLLSNCCNSQTILNQMINNNIFELLGNFALRVQHLSKIPSNLLTDCQYLFLNLLLAIRKYLTEHFQFSGILDKIFGKREGTALFKDLLNVHNSAEVLKKTLILVQFFSNYFYKYSSNNPLVHFLFSQDLLDLLQQISKEKEELSQNVQQVLRCLYDIKHHYGEQDREENFI